MRNLKYADIEESMLEALERQDILLVAYAERSDKLADAEIAFRRDYAQACMQRRLSHEPPKPTDKVVEEYATVETIAQRSAYLVAKAKESAVKQALYGVDQRLDTLRSLMASHRHATGD